MPKNDNLYDRDGFKLTTNYLYIFILINYLGFNWHLMQSSKFIQIRKERSVEQRLASIWLDACSELEIPCILIYQSNWTSYISLNLKFIPEGLAETLDSALLEKKLKAIQEKYTATQTGYCQHNTAYHTFDGIPNEVATKVAAEIYDTIMLPSFRKVSVRNLTSSATAV